MGFLETEMKEVKQAVNFRTAEEESDHFLFHIKFVQVCSAPDSFS
jgi:hypothetical protein